MNNRKIILYTPWMELGLSYDAKAVYDIAIKNNLEVYISYRTKRKIKWDCNFIPVNKISEFINENDMIDYLKLSHIFINFNPVTLIIN